MKLDAWTLKHLDNWLEKVVHADEQDRVRAGILKLLDEDPSLLDGPRYHSWPELWSMAAVLGYTT